MKLIPAPEGIYALYATETESDGTRFEIRVPVVAFDLKHGRPFVPGRYCLEPAAEHESRKSQFRYEGVVSDTRARPTHLHAESGIRYAIGHDTGLRHSISGEETYETPQPEELESAQPEKENDNA